jgi:hypothetical protein
MPHIAEAIQLNGPKVGGNPEDRWVFTVAYGIAVITNDGRVFAHRVSKRGVEPAVQLRSPRTAANPEDRWVIHQSNRVYVITADGRVYVHPLHLTPADTDPPFADRFPDGVEEARQLQGPKVAANPQDRRVLITGNRILVITDAGDVYAHRIDGDRVLDAVKLSGPKVAANPQDKWVLMYGAELVVITAAGEVFQHALRDDTIREAIKLDAPPVAAQSVDRWVLAPDPSLMEDLGLLVVTSDGRVFSHDYVPEAALTPR